MIALILYTTEDGKSQIKQQVAQADQQNEAELKTLETKIKRRPKK